jgi:hypothetical protein
VADFVPGEHDWEDARETGAAGARGFFGKNGAGTEGLEGASSFGLNMKPCFSKGYENFWMVSAVRMMEFGKLRMVPVI